MKLIVSIQLVFILCWTACSNSQQSTSDVPKKEISDSLFYRYYLEGKYKKLVESNYKLDSDLKQGLYSAALSGLGQFQEAKEAIPHYDEIEFDQYASGEKLFPSKYPDSMGPYEVFAVLKYGWLSGEMSSDRRSFVIDYILEIDSTNLLAKVHDEYRKIVEYGVTFPGFKIVDSLAESHPYWKGLQDMKAKYYAIDSSFDSSIMIRKKLYQEGYKEEKQLNELILTYIKTNRSDSARRYIAKFAKQFPDECSVPSIIFFKRNGQIAEMLKAIQPCLEKEMLPENEKEVVDIYYLEGLIQQGKYAKAEEYLPRSKEEVNSNWEEAKQFEIELRLLLYQEEYVKYKELIEGGYGEYLCKNCSNALKQLTKQYYQQKPDAFKQSFQKVYGEVKDA